MVKIPENVDPDAQIRIEVVGEDGVTDHSSTFAFLCRGSSMARFSLDLEGAELSVFVSDRQVHDIQQNLAITDKSGSSDLNSPNGVDRAVRINVRGPIPGENPNRKIDWSTSAPQ